MRIDKMGPLIQEFVDELFLSTDWLSDFLLQLHHLYNFQLPTKFSPDEVEKKPKMCVF